MSADSQVSTTREEVISLLDQLVRIESVTPWLIKTGSGEAEIAEFMGRWLAAEGLEVTIEEVSPGRPNMLARLKGSGAGPTLCINAHSDTVGYENWVDVALNPWVEGDRMYGLGVVDDKAGCAAAMLALRDLARSGVALDGDVLLACVADEESTSTGSEHLVAHHKFDAAIVIEPSVMPVVVTEHQGFGWIEITVFGKASHGCAPEEGIDAIVHMAEVITRLDELNQSTWAAHPDARNGSTVFHTSTIRGGTDFATYPSQAVLGIEIGTQPGEKLENRVNDIEKIFAEIKAKRPNFRAEIEIKLERDPFVGNGREPLLAALDSASRQVLGLGIEDQGWNAWTDAAILQAAGIPTVLIGPKGGNLHSPNEWVDIPAVVEIVEVLKSTIVNFLGSKA
ncbi:MAG: M20/M25/M40 family metallo-hydrolase [Actinomycetes bacterium]